MGDERDAETSQHIQIEEPAHSIRRKVTASEKIVEKEASLHSANTPNIDDEEKARRIADEDLRAPQKQTYSGFLLLWLSWQATGVIYGDIGTSPLYVYSSTFTSQPSWIDLVGALSIIIWSLTLIVTVKYTFIVLSADDDGQGGTFALYTLLSRYIAIADYAPSGKGVRLQRYRTGDLRPEARSVRRFLENSRASKFLLKTVGVLGVSMIIADGVLTPAQSVLGAIQGIRVVNPELGTSAVVGISCAILVFLFLIQPFGTSKLGTTFAPIVVVWLLFNLITGIYNLSLYDYTVLKAFSPYFAFSFLIRNGYEGWRALGGLLLAFTGVEALFADLGAFGKRAIQISWLCIAYPCLLFAYIGQAAYISQDATGTVYTNPFFNTVPPGTLIFSLVIATLAAIVASQALITSTFQLLSQVMRMSYFPHIKVVHTSRKFHDHVYMPLANWLLMIGTVIVTAVYNNTTSLGNAYGVCVIVVTFLTTSMVGLVALVVWRLPILVVLPIWLVFACLDGVYLTSVLTKVPEGAWFTILLSAILCFVIMLWRFGKEAQWAAEHVDRLPPSALLVQGDPNRRDPSCCHQWGATTTRTRLAQSFGGTPVSVVPGLGIFFDKNGDVDVLPPCFTHFVRKFATRPAVTVFFHMRPLPLPTVAPAERYVVTRTPGVDHAYSVVLRHGYADDVLRPGMARDLVGQIQLSVEKSLAAAAAARGRGHGHSHGHRGANGGGGGGGGDDDAATAAALVVVEEELRTLQKAHEAQVVYVLGKKTMRIKGSGHGSRAVDYRPGPLCRRVLLWGFLWVRENSRAKLADLDVDVDKMVEVGFLKEI